MTFMHNTLVRLGTEEDGQSLIEYALIAGIIALGAIVAMTGLKNQIVTAFGTISNQLSNAA